MATIHLRSYISLNLAFKVLIYLRAFQDLASNICVLTADIENIQLKYCKINAYYSLSELQFCYFRHTKLLTLANLSYIFSSPFIKINKIFRLFSLFYCQVLKFYTSKFAILNIFKNFLPAPPPRTQANSKKLFVYCIRQITNNHLPVNFIGLSARRDIRCLTSKKYLASQPA